MRAAQSLMKERDTLLKHDLGWTLFAIQMSSHGFCLRTCDDQQCFDAPHSVKRDETADVFCFVAIFFCCFFFFNHRYWLKLLFCLDFKMSEQRREEQGIQMNVFLGRRRRRILNHNRKHIAQRG